LARSPQLLNEPNIQPRGMSAPATRRDADQQHPDHQLGIDRGSPNIAVKRLQLFV
jgi:hypothetical protein